MKNNINTLKYIRKDEAFVGLTYDITRNIIQNINVYMRVCVLKQVFLLMLSIKYHKKYRDLVQTGFTNCHLKKFISKIKHYSHYISLTGKGTIPFLIINIISPGLLKHAHCHYSNNYILVSLSSSTIYKFGFLNWIVTCDLYF